MITTYPSGLPEGTGRQTSARSARRSRSESSASTSSPLSSEDEDTLQLAKSLFDLKVLAIAAKHLQQVLDYCLTSTTACNLWMARICETASCILECHPCASMTAESCIERLCIATGDCKFWYLNRFVRIHVLKGRVYQDSPSGYINRECCFLCAGVPQGGAPAEGLERI